MRSFSNVHPVVLIIFFLSVLLISMFTWHPILLLTALASGICFSILLGRGQKYCLLSAYVYINSCDKPVVFT